MNYLALGFCFISISLVSMEEEISNIKPVSKQFIHYFPTKALIYGEHEPLFKKSTTNHDFQLLKDDYKKLLAGAVSSIKQRQNMLKNSNTHESIKTGALDLINKQQKQLKDNYKKAKNIKNQSKIKVIVISHKDITNCLRWAKSCTKVPESSTFNVVFLTNDLVTIHAKGVEELIEQYRKKEKGEKG